MKIAILLMIVALPCIAGPKKVPAQSPLDALSVAKERVVRSLKDPESARFGQIFSGVGDAVCGTVNARNSYGGYGNPARFIVTSARVMIESDSAAMDYRWEELCADKAPRSN